MKNKKELANKLINNEVIDPYYPNWKEFYNNNQIPNNITEYKQLNYELYDNIILWQYANGQTKEEIKQFLIDKFEMTSNYKTITEYDKAMLNIIVKLLNKYFSITVTETHIGILNNKKVIYTWNKLLNYELIEQETTNNKYYPYQLKISLKDWINHSINGQRVNKFSVDTKGNIIKY
mgnify:CR=1 FL=1